MSDYTKKIPTMLAATPTEPPTNPGMHLITPTTPSPTPLHQVRAGQVKALGPNGVQSGIFKEPKTYPVFVSDTGITEDQQAFKGHGGVDKALHQYAAEHYQTWRDEKPDRAHLFQPGAFGENLVASSPEAPDGVAMNEDSVCIGDIYRIGHGFENEARDTDILIQVSEAKMPCFKLNIRFEWPLAAKKTQSSGRIGWYFRVLQGGIVQAGWPMVPVERKHPKWSVANVHRVLHARKVDPALLKEVSELPELGKAVKEMIVQNLEGKMESERGRLGMKVKFFPYRVVQIKEITPMVLEFTLTADGTKKMDGETFGRFAYVRLKFGKEGRVQPLLLCRCRYPKQVDHRRLPG
jgi:MOSC domain-containing protein YiiM